jgi:hypothetical protein
MTKIDNMSTFAGDTITPLEVPKTLAQKREEWLKQNQAAYKKACDANCTCTPSRADMLLIQQYDEGGPSDL